MKHKLLLDLKVGETFTVGDTTIHLAHKSGQQARLVIVAPQDTQIITPHRREGASQERMSAPQCKEP